jgi:molybdopterin molybdotransferase
MIAIERAVEIVMSAAMERRHPGHPDHPERLHAEFVPLVECCGRILREDVAADADSPPFDKSIRDGFAVRSEDVTNVPVTLSVIGESRAGQASGVQVESGTCCEIMTGAPMPSGANAVVMVEHTERPSAASVRILRSVQAGTGRLARGAEAHQGDQLLRSGRQIGLADVGLLANAGRARVLVSKKPSVAIVATGDELVEVGEQPRLGQIRNSNTYTLHEQMRAAGAHPVMLGIARDNLPDLREKIGRALEHDIVLVSGGVSMGKYDLVENVFAEFGVVTLFDSVAMKPGKPTVFGCRRDTFVFGLPGNPISTIVACHLFVRPLVRNLLKAETTEPAVYDAHLEEPAKCDPERAAVVPALVRFESGSYAIRTAPWKGSSDLAGLARANALVFIPRREGTMTPGEMVRFLFLE